MNLIMLPLLLGLMNRIRGGLFGDKIRKVFPFYGTTIGRLLYGLAFGGGLYTVSGSLLLGAIAVGTVFLGHAIGPFAPMQAMAEKGDVFALSIRGVILNGATAVAIGAMGFYIPGLLFALSGLLMGPTYYLAKQLPIIPLFNDVAETRDINDTAEVLFGLLQGLILVIIFGGY